MYKHEARIHRTGIETVGIISDLGFEVFTAAVLNRPLKINRPACTLSCSCYASILKMEAIYSSETSLDSQRTTRYYIREDSTLHRVRCRKPGSAQEGLRQESEPDEEPFKTPHCKADDC
jgi:hypothetical protein